MTLHRFFLGIGLLVAYFLGRASISLPVAASPQQVGNAYYSTLVGTRTIARGTHCPCMIASVPMRNRPVQTEYMTVDNKGVWRPGGLGGREEIVQMVWRRNKLLISIQYQGPLNQALTVQYEAMYHRG